MTDIVIFLTKDKKVHLRYNKIDDLQNLTAPIGYVNNKVVSEIDKVKEKWEIQTIEKIGVDDFRQKLKIDFKLLHRKISPKSTTQPLKELCL